MSTSVRGSHRVIALTDNAVQRSQLARSNEVLGVLRTACEEHSIVDSDELEDAEALERNSMAFKLLAVSES